MKHLTSIFTNIPLTCRLIYFVSFVLYIIGFIFTKVPLAIANLPERVIRNYEVFRLLVTFFSKGGSVLSIIAIVADFLLIRLFFTRLERKYSTVFFFIEIFLQNLTFQLFFTLFSVFFVYTNFLTYFLISYGWTPLIVIFVYKFAFKDRQEKLKITCIQIDKKYLPYIILVLAVIFAFDQFISVGLAVVFGIFQFGLYDKHFISLPLGFYRKIESCIPNCIKNSQYFVKIEDCQLNLVDECCKGSSQADKNLRQRSESAKENVKADSPDLSKKTSKKQRKTAGRNKNNKSGSIEFNQQIQTGRSDKDNQNDAGQQTPNIETNNELNRDNKI